MKKQVLNNATFTGREMQAIAAMLLSSDGINVDPIINDLYPNLDDSQKSLFRCKLALLLKGNLPEFQVRSGFRRTGSSTAYCMEIVSESSLLGTVQVRKIHKYTRVKGENEAEDKWNEETLDEYEKNSIENQNLDYNLFETLDEAIKAW